MGTTKRKTKAQLEREIDQALRGGSPVGRGELLPGSSVVLPHKRTSPTCKKCGQFHTQAEHHRHASSSKKVSSQGARSRASSSRSDSPLEIVVSAVRQMPKGARFGRDVFVYPLWQKVGKKIKMSLTEFKRWLVEQNRMQNLSLVRADLVDAMDPVLVERSEIEDLGGQFHFVIDPGSRQAGQSHRSAPPPTRTEAARTLQGDVDEVKKAIQSIHGTGRFGDRKVFISEVWRKVGKKLGMSLETFKQWLVGRHISQSLVLARADLVSAMNPGLVAASETFAVPGEKYPVYHFVIDDSVR